MSQANQPARGSRSQIGGQFPVQALDVTVPVLAGIATATAIDRRGFAAGSVAVAAGSALTTLTFHGCHTIDGTYLALYDNANNAVTLTVAASRVVQLPAALVGVPFIKITGNAAGSLTLWHQG